jgi:hypothetical protein
MNIDTIKALFKEMREFGVLLFEHTGADGATHKVVLKDADGIDATGISVTSSDDDDDEGGMGFDVKRSIYENPTLGLKDFTN